LGASADDILKLSLAAAALAGGLSVAYHYAVYIPARDELVDASKQTQAQQQKTDAAAAFTVEQATSKNRRTAYRVCLSAAQFDYSNRWNGSCKTRSEQADRSRSVCVSGGTDAALCLQYYPALPTADCELPTVVFSSYDADLKASKQKCMDEAKSGLMGFEG
jgi:hypothetical protein